MAESPPREWPATEPMAAPVPRGWLRSRAWLVALAVLAVIAAIGLDTNLTTDSVRDLLNAQECVQGLRCDEKGTSASVGHLTHGTIWTRSLIAANALGLTPYQQTLLLLSAFALAAGLLYACAARYASHSVALWSTIFFVVFVGASGFPEFSNEYLGLLPQALFYYGLARMIDGGGRRFTVLAGLSLFCCVDAHLSFLALMPLLLLAAATTPRDPVLNLVLATITLVGPAWALSPHQYLQDFRADARLPLAVAGAAAIFAVAGLVGRGWWVRQSVRVRVGVVMALAVAWFGGVGLAVQAVAGWQLRLQFLVPVAAPLAFLLAAAVSATVDRLARLLVRANAVSFNRLRGWWPRATTGMRVAAVGVAAIVFVPGVDWLFRGISFRRAHYLHLMPVVAPFLVLAVAIPAAGLLGRASRRTLRGLLFILFACFFVEVWFEPFASQWAWQTQPKHLQAKALSLLGEYLRSQGWTYQEARRAEGPGLWQTNSKLAFLRLILPPGPARAIRSTEVPRIVLTDDAGLITRGFPGWHPIDLGRGWRAEVSPITPWIRSGEGRVSFEREGKVIAAYDLHDSWAPPSPSAAASGHVDDMPFQLACLRPEIDREQFDGATVRYEFALDATGPDAERDIWILNYHADDGLIRLPVGWQIESIEGLESTISASRLFATVRRGSSSTGRIQLVHPSAGPRAHFVDQPPQFFESRPDEAAIRAAINRSTWVHSKREDASSGVVLGAPG